MKIVASDKKIFSAATGIDPVVILVDNKRRDLNVAALIAHQLEERGIACKLEPLEAFRAVVGAYRPSMIIFNHLNASHLAHWSRRLAEIGILVGVLPNEGLVYEKEGRAFMAGRFHRPHVDHFFCWNEQHREAIIAEDVGAKHVHVFGVPRFDFYFDPWASRMPPAPPRGTNKPRVLFCTNFILAKLHDRPWDADKLYGGTQRNIGTISDYMGAVESQWRSRQRVLKHLEALIDDDRFEVLLRPHPSEDRSFYESWLAGLDESKRSNLVYEPNGSITSLILDCDLEISCESCTTALESWIAGKPTIELIFDRHPMLYRKAHAHLSFECGDPAALPNMVAQHLAAPAQLEKKEARAEHLATWCATPSGSSVSRMADVIVSAVLSKRPSDWTKLDLGDLRRSVKLKAKRAIGRAYHFDPSLWLKYKIAPGRYAADFQAYRKSIEPSDVAAARENLRRNDTSLSRK